MQNTPVTIIERLLAISAASVLALVVFGVATLLHKAISKHDDRKRIQGRPVRWWVTGLYLTGAITGAVLADNKQYYMEEIVGGLGGFGILAGLLVGNIHGGLNLLRSTNPDSSADDSADMPNSQAPAPLVRDDENPYSPPSEQ